eukprot:TRINITY_DN105916_c0_g1_i1.p1 TRINITY_DN105916_c0_g1~~TRINITY_DN105916_c0_g1_i1.p1  ORF type:complete len:278 (+),score=29.48 TRINITY_DN105916_c0_g1_i1:101-934(+)
MACTVQSETKARAGRSQRPLLEIQTADLEHFSQMPVIAAHELRVRNTFIDAGPSPSMARFLRDRMAFSCPGSKVGLLANAFDQSSDTENESLRTSKPQMISLMDALADAPTMPCTPEPLDSLWRPFTRDIDVARKPCTSRCLPDSTQPSLCTADMPAITVTQYAGDKAVTSDPQLPPAVGQSLTSLSGPTLAPVSRGGLECAPMPMIALSQPPGSNKLPSLGSLGHELGQCKPCAFLHTKGCSSGATCKFCHLCDAGAKKRRLKEKQRTFKSETRPV